MRKRIVMVVFCLVLLLGVRTVAEKADTETLLVETTRELEGVLKKSNDNARESFIRDIERTGADFDLSIETFDQEGNPYRNFDYRKFIADYATLQEYCMENGIPMQGGIDTIDFVQYSYRIKEIEEYKPTKIDLYEETENGYIKTGRKYITSPLKTWVYEKKSDGTYERSYETTIIPETKKTKYLEASVRVIDPDMVFSYFQVPDKVKQKAQKRLFQFNKILNHIELGQNIFINHSFVDKAQADIAASSIKELTGNQAVLLQTAVSLIGQVPYEWGGKSEKSGYDNTWWSFTEEGKQKGLDCSGYVQWVFRTAGFSIWNELGSTAQILNADCLDDVSRDELKPGDIGLLNHGETTNHTGIYLGNDYWIHCSSSANTVTVSKFNFRYFKRVRDLDSYDTSGIEYTAPDHYDPGNVSEEEYYVAKFVQAEAGCEGLNGWIGVAEVIKNRKEHPDYFPDTYREVVDQPGQFSTYRIVQNMTSVDEDILRVTKETLDGKIAVLNNPNVLYFQNPDITGYGEEEFNGCKKYMRIGNHCFYQMSP